MFALQQEKNFTEDGEYIFSVTELNLAARNLLEGHFEVLWVSGEISNLSQPSSGHIYFSLKDQNAQIRCAWFRGKQGPQRFQIENGQQVFVKALVTVYPERGDYQLVVERIAFAGLGLLQQKLEALKRKLEAQGLFAAEHKQPLPVIPRMIGIITSPTGAALQDMLSILKRRAPFIPVVIYPCLVQGNDAASSIIRALKRAEQEQRCDVLVLTRGGGSIEDLWPFNDETLARTIFACDLPTVSAVGHEIDFSLCDFVADVRAPTPSAAAELISPDQEHLLALIRKKEQHLRLLIERRLESYAYRLDQLARGVRHPAEILTKNKFKLEFFYESLTRLIHRKLASKINHFQLVKYAFARGFIGVRMQQEKQRLQQYEKQLTETIKKRLLSYRNRFGIQLEKLETLSPIKVLQRGYAVVYEQEDKLIESVKNVSVKQKISVRLIDGILICQVQAIK